MSKTMISAFEPKAKGIPAEEGDDIVFVFSDFKLNIEFFIDDKGFDADKARKDLERMAESIWIDKTYVAFAGTKFRNVFLKDQGWNELLAYIWSVKKQNYS